MKSYTITLNEKQIKHLAQVYTDEICPVAPPYSRFQIKTENCTITAYNSNKVLFQGADAAIYASAYDANLKLEEPTQHNDTPSSVFYEHAGSDEVGTGDYFGPVCVVACAVLKKNQELLKTLKIQDSKQVRDGDILKIAPVLMENLPYSLLILSNGKYNLIQPTNNLNAIKAKLHNQAYIHLKAKLHGLPSKIIVDQFTPEKSYYRYLSSEEQIIKGIHFETKAENKYLAVACASIIARYAFLKQWELMEAKYAFHFIKGASAKVDQNAQDFVNQYGMEALKEVAKVHFINTQRINKPQ